jgi:ATP-dependent protease ClpP protease subunit
MKRPWTITAKSSSALEIVLMDVIGEDFWSGGGITAKQFAEDLKAAGAGIRSIHLKVSSPGGNVWDGLSIFNTLLNHGATVTAEIVGLAASIASVIICAASTIEMNRGSMLMIHNPATLVGGDANELRKMAETLDKVKASMVSAYRRHTSKSVAEIGAIMDQETWYTPAEAKAAGFVEKITEDEDDDADVAARFDLSHFHFRRVPAQIAARYSPRFSADDDAAVRRERIERNRRLELMQMDEDDYRRHTLQMNAIEISRMRAESTPEAIRRRTLAEHAAELGPGGWIGRLTEPDEATVRRRTMAARERELKAMGVELGRVSLVGPGGRRPDVHLF